MNVLIPAIWMAAIVYANLVAILCIGFTMTYITVKIPNFAHGVYIGIGVYVSYTFAIIMNLSPYLGLPIAFFIGGVVSVLIFLFVIQIISRMGGSRVALTISTIAVQIFLTSLLDIFAYWLRIKYKTYALGFLLKEYDFKIGGFQGIFPVSIAFCFLTVVILHWLLSKTKIGIAMKATAEDEVLASILGVNVNNIQMFSWFLTGGLASIAGAMLPFWFLGTPQVGSQMMTTIMAGSLLGGLENVYGAIIGGFGIGLSEIILTRRLQELIGAWIGEYRLIIPMLILILVLLIEPRGLQAIYEKLNKYIHERGEKI
jgi:branched-chain amino acid transport system permease protein